MKSRNTDRAIHGQAMIELIVGMVPLLALIAAIIVVGLLGQRRSRTMAEARRDAAALSMLNLPPGNDILSDASYIRDWSQGQDSFSLSSDDSFSRGDTASFQETVVEKSDYSGSDWELIDSIPGNRLTRLRSDPAVMGSLGLVKGHASHRVLIAIPAFRRLISRSDSIEVESTVWLTSCRGIY